MLLMTVIFKNNCKKKLSLVWERHFKLHKKFLFKQIVVTLKACYVFESIKVILVLFKQIKNKFGNKANLRSVSQNFNEKHFNNFKKSVVKIM